MTIKLLFSIIMTLFIGTSFGQENLPAALRNKSKVEVHPLQRTSVSLNRTYVATFKNSWHSHPLIKENPRKARDGKVNWRLYLLGNILIGVGFLLIFTFPIIWWWSILLSVSVMFLGIMLAAAAIPRKSGWAAKLGQAVAMSIPLSMFMGGLFLIGLAAGIVGLVNLFS